MGIIILTQKRECRSTVLGMERRVRKRVNVYIRNIRNSGWSSVCGTNLKSLPTYTYDIKDTNVEEVDPNIFCFTISRVFFMVEVGLN